MQVTCEIPQLPFVRGLRQWLDRVYAVLELQKYAEEAGLLMHCAAVLEPREEGNVFSRISEGTILFRDKT
jgi:hypothetical protein